MYQHVTLSNLRPNDSSVFCPKELWHNFGITSKPVFDPKVKWVLTLNIMETVTHGFLSAISTAANAYSSLIIARLLLALILEEWWTCYVIAVYSFMIGHNNAATCILQSSLMVRPSEKTVVNGWYSRMNVWQTRMRMQSSRSHWCQVGVMIRQSLMNQTGTVCHCWTDIL